MKTNPGSIAASMDVLKEVEMYSLP